MEMSIQGFHRQKRKKKADDFVDKCTINKYTEWCG